MVNFNTCHHVKQHVKHRGVFWRKQFQGREGWGCSLPLYLAMPLQKKTIVMSSISPTLSLWAVLLWTYRVRYEIAAFIGETKINYFENKHLRECSQCRDVIHASCYSAASVGRVGLERAWSVPALNEVPVMFPLGGMLVRLVAHPPPPPPPPQAFCQLPMPRPALVPRPLNRKPNTPTIKPSHLSHVSL